MIPVHFSRRLGLVPLFALLVLGCGGGTGGVRVEGKLMRGPVAFTASEGQVLHLAFVGKTAKGDEVSYPAEVNPADGTFVVNKVGGGIPPGKYRIKISVSVSGTDPASLTKQTEMNQQFAGFATQECEVTSDGDQKFELETTSGAIKKINN